MEVNFFVSDITCRYGRYALVLLLSGRDVNSWIVLLAERGNALKVTSRFRAFTP